MAPPKKMPRVPRPKSPANRIRVPNVATGAQGLRDYRRGMIGPPGGSGKNRPKSPVSGSGMVKKMAGGGRAGAMKKPQPFKKGGVSVTDLRKMAKDKGYKLVKD